MPRGSQKRPIRHGTPSGYQVHLNRGQEPCQKCKTARYAYQKELRDKNTNGFADNQRKRNAAAYRARKILSELHRREYNELYRIELEKEGLT